jgi:hypothetical protein
MILLRKLIPILLVPLAAATLTHAATTTWPSVSVAEADVAAAISKASDGDTITVPAGQATWSSQLTITKNITLQGAGVGNTIIYDNSPKGTSSQHLLLAKLSKDKPLFRLTGFQFSVPDNPSPSAVASSDYGTGVLEFQGNSVATESPLVVGMTSQFRFDHCKLDQLVGVAMTFRNMLGVVDHIDWIDTSRTNSTTASYWGGWQAACVYMPQWGGQSFGHGSWADDSAWGSNKFLFFEDCSFTGIERNQIFPDIDAFSGARFVARHCTFKDSDTGGHGTESEGRGTRAKEVYNNTFTSSVASKNPNQLRSGTMVIHDNHYNNFNHAQTLKVYRVFAPKLWDYADGVNPYDENGGFVTKGTHTGANGVRTLTDANNTFLSSYDGRSEGVHYIVKNLNQPVIKDGVTMYAQSYIQTVTAHTIEDGGSDATILKWDTGDRYEIWKVKTSLDQPGQGKGILLVGPPPLVTGGPPQPIRWPQAGYPREPIYSWNNVNQSGAQVDVSGIEPGIMAGRDFINRTPKPNYTPYSYPHPLTGVSAANTAPSPPSNLRVVPGG